MTTSNVERRMIAARELRVVGDGTARTLEGYAAVFNSFSLDMGFKERIAPGAFTAALTRSDPRALFNHDPNFVLGRQKSGTLTLAEDETGLRMQTTPPDTQWARDLVATIQRGDIDGMSFSFTTKRDQWAKLGDEYVRTLLEIDELFDVGPVTFPAYPDTTVAARGLASAMQGDVLPTAAALADLDQRSRRLRLKMRETGV